MIIDQIQYINRYVVMLGMTVFSLVTNAQVRWNSAYQNYIDQYKDVAIEQMHKYRVPASITLAQGLLESGAGKSRLAVKGNNHFGIKCHGWTGRTIYATDDRPDECFRAYKNAYESYEDHSLFLVKGNRYRSLFSLKITDYKGWARGLKAAGYATNPQYPTLLINIIECYNLNDYDHAKGYKPYHNGKHPFSGQPHSIYEFNGNYYVRVRKGDTFRSIAEEMGLSYRRIASYNERHRDDTLEEGEIIYLKKKKKKAPKTFKNHIHYVKSGESMYSIAQLYGIRVKYLYKINHLSPAYSIKVGDGLRVR